MQNLERNFEESNKAYGSENKPNDTEEEESLQATLLKLMTEKSRKKIKKIIKKSGPRILTDCDPTRLLRSARKQRSSPELFAFILKSNPKINVEVPDLTSLTASITNEDWPAANQLYRAHMDSVIFQLHGQGKLERLAFNVDARGWVDADSIESNEDSWSRSVVVPRIASKLLDSGLAIERAANALHELRCDLDLIVDLGNAELTKAFLQLTPRDLEYACQRESTLRILVKNVDVSQLQVFLDYNATLGDSWSMSLELLYLLLKNMRSLHETEAGRNFAKTLLRYDLFDDKVLCRFEPAIMQASRENLEVFLEYRVHLLWRSKFKGVDVLASAFGNNDPAVLRLLKNKVTDVETRGFKGRTALHFAMKTRAVKCVGFLLSRGADPNARSELGRRPLRYVYGREDYEKADVECVRLLLIGGADPLLDYQGSRFKEYPQFFGIHTRHLRPECKRIVEYLLAEIAIREALGRSVEKPIEDCRGLMGKEFTDDFYEGCRRQIDELKSHRIRDNLTMFSLLSGRENRTVRVSEDDRCAIASFMRSYKKDKTLILYYYDSLKYRIRIIKRINVYIDATKEVLSESMRICDSDHLVIRKILNCLTLKDILTCERKFSFRSHVGSSL